MVSWEKVYNLDSDDCVLCQRCVSFEDNDVPSYGYGYSSWRLIGFQVRFLWLSRSWNQSVDPSASATPMYLIPISFQPSHSSAHDILFLGISMFSRVSQLARHLSRPLPNYAHTSAAGTCTTRIMTPSAADERNTRTIHTAACLIIGDEVLGGKVSCIEYSGLEEI